MKINEFITAEEWNLKEFRKFWQWGQQEDQKNFPKDLPEAEWREQYELWLASQDRKSALKGK